MPRLNNFIQDFQKDHSKLQSLIYSFGTAIKSSNLDKAREILNLVDKIASDHFNFEETYLYPRLRRLVLELTHNLQNEQQTMKDFINKSRLLLDKDSKVNKNGLACLLQPLPRLSKIFKECGDLFYLVNKFSKEDKDDLNLRFKECCSAKSLSAV